MKKIRFACIEYSTKSGTIWRPAPNKPNYLSDPEKEIDPTSFGCWTSALSGEHIPVSYLRIAQNSDSLNYKMIRFGDMLLEKINKKPLYHNLNYIKKFNLLLILVHSFSMPLMADLIRRLKKINPRAIYLGSISSPLGILREKYKAKREFKAFQGFADQCDLWINVNRAAQDYLQKIIRSKVIYFPQFYPFKYAHQFFQKRQEKEKTILVGGDPNRPDNLAGQFIATTLQKKYPEFLIKIVNFPNLNIEPLKKAGARFKIIPFLPWQKHLKRLSRFLMVINTDITWTLGRLQADCAAVGTPSIGINANNQMEMFPQLTTPDLGGIEKAVLLAEKLIKDETFYRKVQEQALSIIKENSYPKSVQRIKDILREHTDFYA